jgi:hypothetical protein
MNYYYLKLKSIIRLEINYGAPKMTKNILGITLPT